MGDGAVWVAAFTGATAVLASWVTNFGNIRAAKAQAEASAQAQLRGRIRELRRAAYLDFIEHSHVTAELYWWAKYAFDQLTESEQLLARIEELRVELRGAYDPFLRCVRVVELEGPPALAEAAEAVLGAAADTNRALWKITLSEPGARERFDEGRRSFTRCVERFVEEARVAMSDV
jgi:hypothetical protein